MHFILFFFFVRGGFRLKIKCVLNLQSKVDNSRQLAAVRKFHVYERSEVTRIRKFSAYEIFWIYSNNIDNTTQKHKQLKARSGSRRGTGVQLEAIIHDVHEQHAKWEEVQSNLGITTTEGTGSKWSYFSGGLICQVRFKNFQYGVVNMPLREP